MVDLAAQVGGDTLHTGVCLRVVQLSDVGRQREINEESFGQIDSTGPFGDVVRLFVVADGMGGHVAGEVASRVAVEITLEMFQKTTQWNDMAERMRYAVERANAEVYALGNTDHRLTGMGTTVVAAAVSDTGLTLANVGDSRAYLLRNGELTQLTRDHSWVARGVEEGVLTPAQARYHPDRNVIYRSLGADSEVKVDTFSYDLLAGDRVLLCSDGLTDVVEDDYLAELAGEDDPELAVRQMIDRANAAGGPDNITVTMIVVEATASRVAKSQETPLEAEAGISTPDAGKSNLEKKIVGWLRWLFHS